MNSLSIIPAPVKLNLHSGQFNFNAATPLHVGSGLDMVSNYVRKFFTDTCQWTLSSSSSPGSGLNLTIQPDLTNLGSEGYQLHVSPESVRISAPTPAGVFYGFQTFRQLFPPNIESRRDIPAVWAIPCVEIEDYPRFPWRGDMLDVCRHYFPKGTIFHVLDLMALHKLNRFHWHLTEDQGWRIEIKKYPKLATIASKRKINIKNNEAGAFPDPTTFSGIFTQEEVKEVVKYAADRFIQVIPEIEMPGHSTAAITAYPELSCTGGPFTVANTWGVFRDVYCAGKELVFTFLQDVLDEVLTLFPSDIIHIGGDECPKERWKKCPDCQKRMQDEKIATEHDLQTYFTNRIANYLASKGRRLMGWNEILNEGLVDTAIGHFWMGRVDPILSHIRRGRDIVVSRSTHIYLDHSYTHSSLKKVYGFDPMPESLEPEFHKHILGIEAPMWTEHVPTPQRMFWQTFPRLTAIAETGWTPKDGKNFSDFMHRFGVFRQRLEHLGVPLASPKEAEPLFWNRIK
jgi:hexosaminidase